LETIECARLARQANDAAAMVALFAPGARYRLASGTAFLPASMTAERDAAEALTDMIKQFTFNTFEPHQVIVEGNLAALRMKVVTPGADDAPIETEIASFWSFDEEGRITEIVDFVDTALVAQMIGKIESKD
jgi:ketosteroid isomerase-like protein